MGKLTDIGERAVGQWCGVAAARELGMVGAGKVVEWGGSGCRAEGGGC